jgi:uncharacterized protein involved in outer membrane biogenesis
MAGGRSAGAVAWVARRAILRRLWRGALGALTVLVAVLLVGGLVLSRQASALVHARAVTEAARLGAELGRAITIGPAHVSLGAELSVQLDDVRVAAAPGATGDAAAPLFEVGAVRVGVRSWPLLRSLGKDLEVSAVEVRRPVVRLVRLADGALSYADVVEHLAAPRPPRPAGALHVGRVTVTGATIAFTDLARTPALHVSVEKIDASAPEVGPGAPLDVTLDAAVLAPEHNLHLELGLGPEAAASTAPLGRLRRAALRLAPVAIDPLVPFLPARGDLGVAGANLSADVKLDVDPQGPITVNGAVAAAALRLTHQTAGRAEAVGPPVDAALRADLTVDPEGLALTARALSITAGGMTVEGHADLRGPLEAPEVRALALGARDVTFERLLALAPPGLVPPGVTLRGPIALRAEAKGAPRAAEIDVAVDLREATVTLPKLHKPAGTPLSATLRGRTGEGGLTIDALGLTVGPLALALKGKVRSATDVDLTADSGEVALDAILRLFPTVAHAVPAGVTLAGAVQASGHVKRAGAETRAEARVALRRADVKTSALELRGDASLVAAMIQGAGSTRVVLDLDAGAARLLVPGRLDKAAGSPLTAHAVVERTGPVTVVREGKLTMAGATVVGSGRHDTAALAVDLSACDLHLGTLAHTLPALASAPAALAGARFSGAVHFEGDPRDPGAGHLRLPDFDLRAPLGKVKGSLDLRGISPPRQVTLELSAEALDLDLLAAGGHAAGTLPAADAVEVHAKLHVGRLHARALDARDVTLEATLVRGVLDLPRLHLGAFGGTLTGDGSRVDLTRAAPAFTLRGHVERLDLSTFGAGSDPDKEISGRLDADVSLDGAGTDWPTIAPTLSGTVKLGLAGAHVRTEHTLHGHVINPLLGGLAEREKKKHPTREVDVRIERGSVALAVGGRKVTTTAPLTLLTDDGTIAVSGTIGFDKALALTGTVTIPPAVIEKASKGKRVPLGDLVIKVKVDGPAEDPRVEIVDLAASLGALAGSRINAIVKQIRK